MKVRLDTKQSKDHPLSYVHKIFERANISYPLTYTYVWKSERGVRNVSFSENFTYVLMDDPISEQNEFRKSVSGAIIFRV